MLEESKTALIVSAVQYACHEVEPRSGESVSRGRLFLAVESCGLISNGLGGEENRRLVPPYPPGWIYCHWNASSVRK